MVDLKRALPWVYSIFQESPCSSISKDPPCPTRHVCVVSHLNESCLIRMSHVPYGWLTSRMDESCLIWMSAYMRISPFYSSCMHTSSHFEINSKNKPRNVPKKKKKFFRSLWISPSCSSCMHRNSYITKRRPLSTQRLTQDGEDA